MIEPLLSDDALLADIEAARQADSRALHVWWLGQSGFLACVGERSVLFDPYLSDSLTTKYEKTEKPHVRMSRRVIDPARLRRVDSITSTHRHTDHLDADTIKPIFEANVNTRLVLPKADITFAMDRLGCEPSRLIAIDAGMSETVAGVHFYGVPAAHDTIERTAIGHVKCLGYVVVIGDYTLFHSGDTVRYERDADEIHAALKRANLGRVQGLRTSPIDLAILPINGKVGNMNGTDAARLAKQINARLVVPCHYNMFEFNTAEPEELFVPECRKLGQAHRVLRMGERLSLTVFP